MNRDKYKKPLSYSLYWLVISLSRNNKFFRTTIDFLAYAFYKFFRNNKFFVFQKRRYHYFYHLYNRTVAGERVVEIPLARKLAKEYQDKNILEVGNVLDHYFPIFHDVLDKYEKGDGVINKDVVTFETKKRYDLIVSVSTMEHVGYSYGEKRDLKKVFVGIENLKKHLAKKGMMFVTFPVFYHPNITKMILERKMPFNDEHFFERKSFLNEWEEVDFEEAIKGVTYDQYFANANILYVGIFRNK